MWYQFAHFIGACRLVWIPRQLGYAAIAESVFCLYTVRYTHVSACVSTHMLDRSLHPVLVI